MIPESLRKQQRALYLHMASFRGETLTQVQQKELAELDREAGEIVQRNLRRAFAQARALDAHQKRTKGLNIGTYCAVTA